MSDARSIKQSLLEAGLYSEEADLAFLTDDHLAAMEKNAVEIKGEAAVPFGEHTWNGNHWVSKTESGVRYWYWEDKVGSQCGRERTWKYKVNTGDSVREAGRCPQGYPWFEMKLHY